MDDTRDNILRFFCKVIREYNCGDVKWLLTKKTPTLGPLLATVATGIDTVGGMLFGFSKGSERRSVDFMKGFMALNDASAGDNLSLRPFAVSSRRNREAQLQLVR